MADFNEALETASKAILKRGLSEDEKVEFLELGAVLGMETVKDYLYMLMVFKRNEDRLNRRFDEMGELERKINGTLESSISKVLGDGAREIGRDMAGHIAEETKGVLAASDEFHFLRGQMWMVCLITLLMTTAYWLGTMNVFQTSGGITFIDALFMLPAGGVAFVCAFFCTVMWAFDHWRWVKKYISYKVVLALQGLVLLALLSQLLS
jgi:hypothetical protein